MSEAALNEALDMTVRLRMILSITITALLLAQFLAPFLYVQHRRKAWLPAATYAAVLLTLYLIPGELRSATARAIAIAAAGAVCALHAHGRHWPLIIYLMVTFYALRAIASAIRGVVFAILYDAFFNTATSNPQRLRIYIGCSIVELAVWVLLLWGACAIIRHVYWDKDADLTIRESLLLSAPSAVAVVADLVLGFLRLEVVDYVSTSVQVEWNACILELTTFLSILATTALFSHVRQAQNERTRRDLLTNQLADMRTYIGDMESLYSRMRGFQHDMANHLQTLDELQKGGDAATASAYAQSGMEALLGALPSVSSGNPVTDVILSRLKQTATGCGISFRSDFHWPPHAHVDAFDASIVLHNAGSNAIRAAQGCRNAFVTITSLSHRETFMIEVTNSCDACPQTDPLSGLPVRNSGSGRGIGLLNIRSVAEKYGGVVQASCTDQVFTLTVLFPPAHDVSSPAHNR